MEKGPGQNPVVLCCYSLHHHHHYKCLEHHKLPLVSKVICDLDCVKIQLHPPEFNPKLERQNDEKSIIEVIEQMTVVSALCKCEYVIDQVVINTFMKYTLVSSFKEISRQLTIILGQLPSH